MDKMGSIRVYVWETLLKHLYIGRYRNTRNKILANNIVTHRVFGQ